MIDADRETGWLDALFHPGSIAVVGVPRGKKIGQFFLTALLDQGFAGPIYPVHPEAESIAGLRAAIPERFFQGRHPGFRDGGTRLAHLCAGEKGRFSVPRNQIIA